MNIGGGVGNEGKVKGKVKDGLNEVKDGLNEVKDGLNEVKDGLNGKVKGEPFSLQPDRVSSSFRHDRREAQSEERIETSPFARLQNDLEIMVSEFEATGTATKMVETEGGSVPNGKVMTEGERSVTPVAPFATVASAAKKRMEILLPPRPSSNASEAAMNDSIASRSLWIGNLDPTITEVELRAEFAPFGAIKSLRLLPTKECAFVNYYNLEDAMVARKWLQGAAIGNMFVRIGFGKMEGGNGNGPIANGNRDDSPSRSLVPTPPSFGESSNGGQSVNNKSVWVGQVEPDCDAETLISAFCKFGEIESCRVLDAKNCAFVNFTNAQDADAARVAMNGIRLGTAVIKTGFAKSSMAIASYASAEAVGRDESSPLPRRAFSSSSYNDNAHGNNGWGDEENVVISTREVPADEFKHPIPLLPVGLRLPNDLNSSVVRECRRRVEHPSASTGEADAFAAQIFEHILAASVDPVGNILVQKLIEKGSEGTRTNILHILGPHMATVGIHKNGTWVVQKLIHHCLTFEQRNFMAEQLQPYVVPLMQDQFGNYVVQCCLLYGPVQNQFIFDALYHRCTDIAMSRFGSRAMRSCLDSPVVSVRQKKFVAMALINHALTLVHDANGVIVIQWLLDSDLPGRQAFIAPVLKGHLASLCLSKHASSVVAKLIQQSSDTAARDLVIEEVFGSPALPSLLQEPMAAAIILRALTTARPEQRLKMAHQLEPHLAKLAPRELPHLQKIGEEAKGALEIVQFESERRNHLRRDHLPRDHLPRIFSQSPGNTLLTHAVGGPVTNRAIIRSTSAGRQSVYTHQPIDVPSAISPMTGMSLSFGSVNTIIPTSVPTSATHEPIPFAAKVAGNNGDRISFGPSLLRRIDLQVDRSPTPPS